MKYIILITFLVLGEPKEFLMRCPDYSCVMIAKIEFNKPNNSAYNFKCWNENNYAKVLGGWIWPPEIELNKI